MEAKPGATGAAAERVYEDFEPKMEWERELGDDTLRVHLPGFKKEQVRVQVTSSRVIRISGERQLSGDRWSRFVEEIPISSDFNHKEISAKFDGGILYVKQPKLIVPDAAKQQEQEKPPVESSTLDGKTPQEKAPPPSESAPGPQKQPQEKPTGDQQRQPGRQNGGKIEGAADENLGDSSLDSTKMDKDEAAKGLVSGAERQNTESDKKDFSGLVMEMKKPRKLVNLVLFFLSVVVLGMYASKAISWSFKKSEILVL